jgi:hypothetical protein
MLEQIGSNADSSPSDVILNPKTYVPLDYLQ